MLDASPDFLRIYSFNTHTDRSPVETQTPALWNPIGSSTKAPPTVLFNPQYFFVTFFFFRFDFRMEKFDVFQKYNFSFLFNF